MKLRILTFVFFFICFVSISPQVAHAAVGTSNFISTTGIVGKTVSIDKKADGFYSGVFHREDTQDLYYFNCLNHDCSSSNSGPLVTTGDIQGAFWFTTGSTGNSPMVFYANLTDDDVYVRRCSDNTCSIATTTALGFNYASGTGIDIGGVLRPDGTPLVAFFSGSDGNLRLIDCLNTTCGSANIYDTGEDGGRATVKMDPTDNLPVIVYNSFSQVVRSYRCTNLSCSAGTVGPQIENSTNTYSHPGKTFEYLSDDTPFIGYWRSSYNGGNYRVVGKRCVDSKCQMPWASEVDVFGQEVGSDFDVYFDGEGDLNVMSHGVLNAERRLVNAKCLNIDCSSKEINNFTSGPWVGNVVDVGVRDDNNEQILFYYNDATDDFASFTNWRYQITNLDSGLNVTDATDTNIEINTANGQVGTNTLNLLDSSGLLLARINTDMSTDRNWGNVSGDSDLGTRKSFVHNLVSAEGTDNSYTLYIPKALEDDSVYICPGATSLGQVAFGCSNGYFLYENNPNVTVVNINAQTYWQVEGMTGTGGVSLFSFDLRDTLTRLEVSQASDHTIEFGSINDTNASGNTIVVDFNDDWNTSSITVADIDLEDDGVDKTLAGVPGADIWGVAVNSVTDTITFTAPTSGTDYIAAGSIIVVKVGGTADGGSNQIVNPGSVNSYEIALTITNSSGTETGEIEIPIIDDDTVNVTGYIDSFITFDIDTSEADEDCDAQGGANPCDSHGGATDDAGYVVDLGELTTSTVNDSGDTVLHADGLNGEINSIYFDLSINATGGGVVTVQSLNAGMDNGSSSIPTVSDGSEIQITAGSGLYGINSFTGLTNTATSGAAVISVDCDGTSGNDYYCDTPGMPVSIFDTNSSAIDELRLEWEVGISPDALDSSGTYTDQLTFIATATF